MPASLGRRTQCARRVLARLVLALVVVGATRAVALAFTTFESGPVRPLALSPDGTRLFVCNTPDDRVEILDVAPDGTLTRAGSVTVGLEPVAVAARSNGEIWVVNHLSDSVSVVDVSGSVPRVVRTLLVGDEPRDVVFAGPGRTRAFVTTARRGQNLPPSVPPLLTTPSTPRALVWVFDATSLGTDLGGTPLAVLELFADTPRALAVSPDGATVYAAAFHSGNGTTTLSEGVVCDGGASAGPCNVLGTTYPGGLPAPNANHQGVTGPETGLIVRFDGTHWRDGLGRTWDAAVRFTLPDQDVFAIDAAATPPVTTHAFSGVGTVLFDMATNPVSGALYVANTEARNEVRFEGPGGGGSTVRGHLAETRVSVLQGTSVTPRHLNPHIDYGTVPSPTGVAERSLATPLGLAVSGDGATLYLAAFGSDVVATLDVAALESGALVPDTADHIAVAGGPSGLVLDEPRQRLYVATRFDDAVAVVDLATRQETSRVLLHDPEPPSVVAGRRFLYDARATSSNGEAACASCHVFADFDSLAWDLGNPDGDMLANPNPLHVEEGDPTFHPLKGPMTTQSLRGLANAGPMHWRGDRTGGSEPGGDPRAEDQAFRRFSVAFDGLLGRGGPLDPADMDRLTEFVLQITYPPNPIRNLDGSLTTAQQAGRDRYFGAPSRGPFNCRSCHVLTPSAGFFGTDGATAFQIGPQPFKIPHLRNAYQKVGMFGMPAVPFFAGESAAATGPQVRGFGFMHDGSVDTLRRFHGATLFDLSDDDRTALTEFVLAYDSNLAPIVGQQITLTATNRAVVDPRIDLLVARANAGECDLVAKAVVGGIARGFLLTTGGAFASDRTAETPLADAALRAVADVAGQDVTYTCVPPGSGARVGVDRDEDGFRDRDELDAGTDPDDASDPGGGPTPTPTATPRAGDVTIGTRALALEDGSATGAPSRRRFAFRALTKDAPSGNRIVIPTRNGASDPTAAGAVLRVYNAAGTTTDDVRLTLPAGTWKPIGGRTLKGFRYRPARASGEAVRRILVTADAIVVDVRGITWPYTLDETAQGRIGVVLKLGATRYCAETPPNPAAKKPDRRGKFVGAPHTAAPAACPAEP